MFNSISLGIGIGVTFVTRPSGGAVPPSVEYLLWQGSGTDYLEYSSGNQLIWQ